MSLRIPVLMPPADSAEYIEQPARTNGRARATQKMAEREGYLRVPVWVVVLLITIAGGLILNGAATVYWAATFKQSFSDFKEETYKQKTEHLEAEILRLQNALRSEEAQRKADIELLTERQNDTRLKMAEKGIFTR